MDEKYTFVDGYLISDMCDEHTTAFITEKDVDVSNVGTLVMGEDNSSIITFKMNRYYDGVDLAKKKIKIMYRNSNEIFKSDVCNVKMSDDSILFSWIISVDATKNNKVIAYIAFISENYLLKTKDFQLEFEKSFDPNSSEPSVNWFSLIESKLEKIELDVKNNKVYEWAKQPEKPNYTSEEVGALSKDTSIPTLLSDLLEDELHRTVTDEEKEAWNNTVLSSKKNEIEIKKRLTISGHKAGKWLKTDSNGNIIESEKPEYTSDEVHALPDTTHIPSSLSEMADDDEHQTITSNERENWNAKSDFSGSYNDLSDIPDIKQLTDDLKEKYDDAAKLSKENKTNISKKLDKSGYESKKWLQTDDSGDIVANEKPKYTASEIGAATADHNHDSSYASKEFEHTHDNKEVLDGITSELIESWNNKSDITISFTDDGIIEIII